MDARAFAAAMDSIDVLFVSSEAVAYLGEEVTMIQHQLQAGALAVAARAPDALAVAALLHDVGHMVGDDDAAAAMAADVDAHHDVVGARWLAQWFGPDVTEPVRLHVAAKRYLVTAEPGYAARLSPASVHTLRLQGGPMSSDEANAFAALPHASAAAALRRFDEAAKDAAIDAPALATYHDLLARVLRGAAPPRGIPLT
jgi:gamma-butyrobetaine dioxygenase